MSDDQIENILDEFDVDMWMQKLDDISTRQHKLVLSLSTVLDKNQRAVNKMAAEIATLRAKLEVCTAFAEAYHHECDLGRFRAAKDAFLAACGVTPTPDDTPEGT